MCNPEEIPQKQRNFHSEFAESIASLAMEIRTLKSQCFFFKSVSDIEAISALRWKFAIAIAKLTRFRSA